MNGNLTLTIAGVAFVEGAEDCATQIIEGAAFLGRQWRSVVRTARGLTVHRQRWDAGFAGMARRIVTQTEYLTVAKLHALEAALDAADAAGEAVRAIFDDGNRTGDFAVYVVDIEHDPAEDGYVPNVRITAVIKDVWS